MRAVTNLPMCCCCCRRQNGRKANQQQQIPTEHQVIHEQTHTPTRLFKINHKVDGDSHPSTIIHCNNNFFSLSLQIAMRLLWWLSKNNKDRKREHGLRNAGVVVRRTGGVSNIRVIQLVGIYSFYLLCQLGV